MSLFRLDAGIIRSWNESVTGSPRRSGCATPLSGRERLLRSLRQLLARTGMGQQARGSMVAAVNAFVAVEQTDQVREAHLSIERDGQRRIEGWLNTLSEEGLLSLRTMSLETLDSLGRF